MIASLVFPPAQRRKAALRSRLLVEFDGSGLSAAEFARRRHLNYATFCRWRRQAEKAGPPVRFAEVELPPPVAASELVVELSGTPRLRIGAAEHIPWAAQLLKALR